MVKYLSIDESYLTGQMHHPGYYYLISSRKFPDLHLDKIQAFEGARHNLPDEDAFKTTQLILQMLKSIPNQNDSLLFILVSGGGSALLCCPIKPLTVSKQLSLIKLLASKGADITQLNTVRSSLSEVKGGKLLDYVPSNVRVISLIISDIVGDPLQYVASGPTITPTFFPKDALKTIDDFGIKHMIPNEILEKIEKNEKPRAPKSEEILQNLLIGNNMLMLQEAKNFITDYHKHYNDSLCKFKAIIVSNRIKGEAKLFGEYIANIGISISENLRLASSKSGFKDSNSRLFELEPYLIEESKIFIDSNEFERIETIKFLENQIDELFKEIILLPKVQDLNPNYILCLIFGGECTVEFDVKTLPSEEKLNDSKQIQMDQNIIRNFNFPSNSNYIKSDTFINHKKINDNKEDLYTFKGGRNQELVLSFLISYLKREVCNPHKVWPKLNLLSVGSDGQDGPTDSAGAFMEFTSFMNNPMNHLNHDSNLQNEENHLITTEENKTLERFLCASQNYLTRHDSYHFFESFLDGKYHFKPGLSGTNVMDMQILYVYL
ncbi:unnamed protein product [Gordionus sp. m RMFG-2023]